MLLRTSKANWLRITSWTRFSHGSPLGKGSIRILTLKVNVGLTRPFSQEKIMEIQCNLLISSFKDPKTIRLMKENITRSSDGSSSHSAGAVKLGLKKAFELRRQAIELRKQQELAAELKKQQEQAAELEKQKNAGVLLRCSRVGCARYNTPVTYSVVGTNLYCQNCQYNYGNYYMQCVGCSYQRTANYTSCQSCSKNFL